MPKMPQRLFREYVEAWLLFKNVGVDIDAMKAAEARAPRSKTRCGRWWAPSDRRSTFIPAGLFTAAVNDVIDMHEKRYRSIEDRVPDAVIFMLFAVSALSLGQVAYSGGLTGRRRQVANVLFAFVIALVLVIILDIDRPRRGLVQVSQESMLRLQQSFKQSQGQLRPDA